MGMAIIIKSGVVFKALKPEVYGIFAFLDALFATFNVDCIITSANDSTHLPRSWHYKDLALDLRSKHLDAAAKQIMLRKLRTGLGTSYTVLLEHIGEVNEHFHIEFDPKG